ncbi:unnamed protein product [Gadus morhua 'NCC']
MTAFEVNQEVCGPGPLNTTTAGMCCDWLIGCQKVSFLEAQSLCSDGPGVRQSPDTTSVVGTPSDRKALASEENHNTPEASDPLTSGG